MAVESANAFFSRLKSRAQELNKRIVFSEGEDSRIVEAAERLAQEGLVRPVLLGPPRRDITGVARIDPLAAPEASRYAEILYQRRTRDGMTEDQAYHAAREPLYFAALMVAAGDADGTVGGACHTTRDVIRAALHAIGLAPGASLVTSAFIMALRSGGFGLNGLLVFADCGVVVEPSASDLAKIAIAAAETTRSIVEAEPAVALLSFSTKGSAHHAETEKVAEALRLAREIDPALNIDGELQLDAALVPEVARVKAPGSAVAGRANTLIFPDLNSGNIAYKLVERLAGAVAIGPVLQGLARPANDLSRGCSADDVLHMALVTAIQAEGAARGKS